jgi:hypothetical protein
MLRAGLPWRLLPACELGAGSPVTRWRRLRDWQAAGVWQQLHAALLDELGRADGIDWSRVCLDSLSVRAKRGRRADGPQPDRPRQARLQVSSGHRPAGHPAGGGVIGGQLPRRAAAGSHGGCDPAGHGAVPAGPANAPPSCTATKPTTPHAAGGHCADGASCPGSPGAGSSPARSSAAIDGWWSGRWPDWSATAASGCATSGAPTCSKRSCT